MKKTPDNNGKYPSGAFFNYPTAGPLNDYFGYLLKPYLGKNTKVFACPLSAQNPNWRYYDETYGSGIFPTLSEPYAYQTYVYLGNYARGIPEGQLFSRDVWDAIKAGLIYPRNNASERTLLFQDVVSDWPWTFSTNHIKPNRLFTDLSIETGPADPMKELEPHVTYVSGHIFYW